MNLNERQKQATTQRDSDLLVAASAGSGKTTVLVERVGSILLTEKRSLDDLLVLTFTKAAALEMQNRIAKLLTRNLTKNSDSSFINQQLAKLPKSDISTIDSFCLNVVRQYYPIIGLSAKRVFNTLVGYEESQLNEEALTILCTRHCGEAGFTRLVDLTAGRAGDLQNLKAGIKDLAEKIQQSRDPRAFSNFIRQQYLTQDYLPEVMTDVFFSYLNKWIKNTTDVLNDILANFDEVSEKQRIKKRSIYERKQEILQSIKNTKELPELFALFKQFLNFTDFSLKSKNNVNLEEPVALLDKLQEEMLGWLMPEDSIRENFSFLSEVANTLVDLAWEYEAICDELKEERGLTYSDMERYCLAILEAENGSVAQELKNKYHYILVDEFQDTSFIQDNIIKLIKRENNVFRVGDVKQSIYGFRNAQPQLFLDYQNDQSTQKIFLVDNYRSSTPLINFVNTIFAELFNLPGHRSLFSSADEVRKAGDGDCEDKAEMVFITDTLESDEENEEEKEIEEIEKLDKCQKKATYIAEKIKELNKQGVALSDIAVLVRSTWANEIIEDIFSKQGIRVKIAVKGNFSYSPKVLSLQAALMLSANINDEIALIAVLRNIFDITEEQLAQWRVNNKASWLEIIKEEKPEIYQKLKSLTSLANKIKISALFDLWCEQSDFKHRFLTLTERHNLQVFRSFIVNYEENSLGGLNNFLFDFAKMQELGDKCEAVIYGTEDDVVKVETIHNAKGKEYPYVFLWGRDTINYQDLYQPIFAHSEFGLSLKMVTKEKRYRSDNLVSFLIRRQIKEQVVNEEVRLLYVAMTRAQKGFYYVDVAKPLEEISPLKLNYYDYQKTNSYTTWLQSLLARNIGRNLVEISYPKLSYSTTESPVQKLGTAFTTRISPFNLQEPASKHRMTTTWQDTAALKAGTEIHSLINKCLVEKTFDKEVRLQRLFANPLFRDCLNYDYASEYSYYLQVDQQIVQGIIDFICFKNEEIIIIDFKSDRVDDTAELINRYEKQLTAYCDIMKERMKLPVKGYLYSIYLDKMIEVK